MFKVVSLGDGSRLCSFTCLDYQFRTGMNVDMDKVEMPFLCNEYFHCFFSVHFQLFEFGNRFAISSNEILSFPSVSGFIEFDFTHMHGVDSFVLNHFCTELGIEFDRCGSVVLNFVLFL